MSSPSLHRLVPSTHLNFYTSRPFMDLDPPSSQSLPISEWLPVQSSEAVRWNSRLPPSNPELAKLEREHQQLKENIFSNPRAEITPNSSANSSTESDRSQLTRSRTSNHPAYARFSLNPCPDSQNTRDNQDLMSVMVQTMYKSVNTNAFKKGRRPPPGDDELTRSTSDVSELSRSNKPSVRREHTAEGLSSTSLSRGESSRSHVKRCTTDPQVVAHAPMLLDEDHSMPVAGPSRLAFKPIIRSDTEYEFPSSTPTPPPKRSQLRKDATSSSSSSLSASSKGKGSSRDSSYVVPLLSIHPSQLYLETADSAACVESIANGSDDRSATPSPVDDMSVDSDNSLLQESYVALIQPSIAAEPLPSPLIPPAPYFPTPSMSPPPPAPLRPPTASLVPPPLSRPFVPPLRILGASQAVCERPRLSQAPRPLGMLPRTRQPAQGKFGSKQFKPPSFVRQKSAASVSVKEKARVDLNGAGGPSAHAGFGEADAHEGGGFFRSSSPVIPDPPYVAERMQAARLDEHTDACAHPKVVLQMSARRPELMDDAALGGEDANSSADMWRSLDDS